MSTSNRILANGDYLIIARREQGNGVLGYYHQLCERSFLVDNILAFLRNYPAVDPHDVMVYELRELNMNTHLTMYAVMQGMDDIRRAMEEDEGGSR